MLFFIGLYDHPSVYDCGAGAVNATFPFSEIFLFNISTFTTL